MAEQEAGASGSTDINGYSGDSAILKSPEEEEEEEEEGSGNSPDLKSAPVTSVLNLEELDVDLFRGTHHWVPYIQRLYGGQIIGQALVAAAKTVNDNLHTHSLHCYFVRAGDPKVPVLYQVDRMRDGHSFAVRSVKATQHGKPILICQASFQTQQQSPLQHQFTMPVVPPPEDLQSGEQLVQLFLSKPMPEVKEKACINKLVATEVPIEIRPVNPGQLYRIAATEPKTLFWVRARGYIGEGNMKLHCCVAAYLSDYFFLGTTLLPFPNYRAYFSASLDHAMWFHSEFRSDEWMLYECESPWAGHSRGLVHGRLWRRDGVLAASSSQEGVIRVTPVPGSSKL